MSYSDSAADMVLDIVRRRKWIGLIVAAVALSASAPLPFFLPDIYRATTTVLVEHRDAGLVRPSVAQLETRLLTIRQQVMSRSELAELIERFDLYPDMRGTATMEAMIGRMRQDIVVDTTTTDPRHMQLSTTGIAISYVGLEPETTAEVANALATLYVEQNTDMRTREAGRTAGFLKGELEKAALTLAEKQSRLDGFKSQNAPQLPQQTSTNLATLQRLNLSLQMNSDQQIWAKQRQDKLTQELAQAEAVEDPELVQLRNRLVELSTQFTDRHPEIIYLRERIAELQAKGPPESTQPDPMEDRLRVSLAEVEAEIDRLQREERGFRAQIASFDRRLEATPQRHQELDALEKEYTAAKDLHDSLRRRYEEAQLAEDFEHSGTGEAFRILDAALPPSEPAAPNRVRMLVMVLLFVVAAGVGAMVVAEQLDTSFYSLDDITRFTTVPVVATIPFMKTRTQTATAGVRLALATSAVMIGCAALAWASSYMAREDAQLVWILARGQL